MKEVIDKVIASLTELREHHTDLEDIKSQHEAASADLEAVNADLATKKEELAKANATLSTKNLKTQKEHEDVIYAKQIELRDLMVKVKAADDELKEKQTRVNSASTQHDEILASLESLKKKLA